MTKQQYHLCGVGGSGMLPLAVILASRGHIVTGSDRALDQGRLADKFNSIRGMGITLFPQDGSGVQEAGQILIVSAAVEESVPDVIRARQLGCEIETRAQLLSSLLNSAPKSISIGGTSGKSTTTAMLGWILHSLGKQPTIINGAEMLNFYPGESRITSAISGESNFFVGEADESDGSIRLYRPSVGVLTNITRDHKSIAELRTLFSEYLNNSGIALINCDDPETIALKRNGFLEKAVGYSIKSTKADFVASDIKTLDDGGYSFCINGCETAIKVIGEHNISNATAAIASAVLAGIDLDSACNAMRGFAGVKRRLQTIGQVGGISVIDDFAHNAHKIKASISTLRAVGKRKVVFFQPHGFGPLKAMSDELIELLPQLLQPTDGWHMSEPVYFGGTVDRNISSRDVVQRLCQLNVNAVYHQNRKSFFEMIIQDLQEHDVIVIMGARDDSLTDFACEILEAVRVKLINA